ncbi:ISAs1 family transposase [Mediterraneibacter sp. NSJ-55]|uniref:ISAs1 family transposase n=1 Tax=Mediterraneibacter hominis TaxID=2763054 RepID=A0A923LJH2_9FIRM|nr:ISAs1 family transposase [Mediterraneibacter hominis]
MSVSVQREPTINARKNKYLELPHGLPSHDTIQRVFAIVPSEFLENFQKRWNELLNSEEGKKIKRLLAIDGKTQRGNGNKNQKGNHIVSAVDERGFCLGQTRVEEKTNEITAIPELLDSLNIKGTIITTDVMGTQTAIVKKIRKKSCRRNVHTKRKWKDRETGIP